MRVTDRRARTLVVLLACALSGSATAALASAVDARPDAAPRVIAAPPRAVEAAPVTPAPLVIPATVGPIGPPAPAAKTRPVAGKRKARPSREYYRRTAARRVPAAKSRGFVPLYREAAETFGIDWRLIASVHKQETAFSTVPSTYRGRNAFGCCAGPMQFNVTNGPVSTWEAYRNAYRQGQRPASYPHPTRSHPSIYDDFDAIMAAAMLLRDGGATQELGGGSWSAAYAYYGRDLFGITYASQVLGRARGWAQEGFCTDCPDDPARVAALEDAYGVAARRELLAAEAAAEAKEKRAAKRRAARKKAKAERERRAASEDSAGQKRPSRPASPSRPEPPQDTREPAPPPRPTTTGTTTQSSPPPQTTTAPPPPPPATTEAEPPPPPPPGGGDCAPLADVLGCG